jgi:2-polyprenyl-6-methoxyphenol hydroxylase-like FAD-dependent oxidoreductase
MTEPIRKVVILGGGTAGWMAASYLGKALQGTASVTVLEAPSIPRIGVGEATIPNLQTAFFDYLGIEESEWMRECNASFKLGIRFINWRTPGAGQAAPRTDGDGAADSFYHVFGQLENVDGVPLSHYWAQRKLAGTAERPFDASCYPSAALMDAKLAPRDMDGTRHASYAWHFDARLVADFLCRFATRKQGVIHVQDEMVAARQDDRGYVTALTTKSGAVLEGDLFIDCSGFRGLLINQALAEPFIDMSDQLLCNSAVATAVPHDDEAGGVEPYTSSIAMSAGWTWKIPMLGRFGTGYVYSADHTTRDEATEEFCRMWGLDPAQQPLNHIRFRVGRNRRAWVRNVVSLGLASCFVEPLESTGLYFTYAAVYQLVKHFPSRAFEGVLADRFNQEIETMFDSTRDFIQGHFALSPRTDTEFWRANKQLHLDRDFTDKIAAYRAGLAVNMPLADTGSYYTNFEVEFRNFWTNSNYYCVFAGLGLLPDHALPYLAHMRESRPRADRAFAEVARRQRELTATLPTAHEYLRRLHG